jgi:flavin reductase (DIM6/NTAB) family NADH-FMN oxidoreductase RutF
MSISSEEFRRLLSRFASGVCVVTSRSSDGKFFGITVSAFSSVSLNPPLVLICIEKTTASHEVLLSSGSFVVNLLSETQVHLSEHFAQPSGDKFEGVDFEINSFGLPELRESLGTLECRVVNKFEAGDHTIFIGQVDGGSSSDSLPLLYYRGQYRKLSPQENASPAAENTIDFHQPLD